MTYTTPPFNTAVAFDGTRHRSVMDILVPAVGGKWVVFVVRALSRGPLCFSQLRRVTTGFLSACLR
jgi:DNA-binding HxlR family transcriptional regulator